eukprot:1974671-Pleurochrysis_carterae.AAC.1
MLTRVEMMVILVLMIVMMLMRIDDAPDVFAAHFPHDQTRHACFSPHRRRCTHTPTSEEAAFST